MKKMPVVPREETPTQRELRRRIDLSNRPRLGVGLARLDEVAFALASSDRNRGRFVQDPTGYLQSQALPVSSCNLVKASTARTSEVCSVNAVCNANAAVNVNAGTKVNVALAVNAFTLANVVNTVYVYNAVRFFGFNDTFDAQRADVAFNNQSLSQHSGGIL